MNDENNQQRSRQLKKLLEPLMLGSSKLGTLFPTLRSANHGTNSNHQNINQPMAFRMVATRVADLR